MSRYSGVWIITCDDDNWRGNLYPQAKRDGEIKKRMNFSRHIARLVLSAIGLFAWPFVQVPAWASTPSLPQYAARLWQMEDGLPHTIVQAITQTRDGYLWIGTREGLARFDGQAFFSLTAKDFGTGLVQPSVVCLCETQDGTLWIGTENVGLFRLQEGRLARFGKQEGLRDAAITRLQETADGSLWIAARGLAQLKDGEIKYPFDSELGSVVLSLFLDHEGTLWISSLVGVRRLQGQKLAPYVPANRRSIGVPRCVVYDRKGTVWAGDTFGITQVRDGNATDYRKGDGPIGVVGAVFPDREGNVWVGAYAGVSRFVDGRFIAEKGELGESYRVFCFFQDGESNVWVGSENGLIRLTPQGFTTYTKQQGLTENAITSVCAGRDGGVWIGVWGGGVNRFLDGGFTAIRQTNGLASDFVLAIREARDGSLWVGTDYGAGLNHIKEGRIAHYKLDPVFTALLEDERGNMWIGSTDSLTCFREGKFERFTTRDGLSANQINALCEGRGGILWVGTEGGLTRGANGHFLNLAAHEPRLKERILSLYEDPEGTLWIGTRGAGLLRFRAGGIDTFTSLQGLVSDSIYAVLEDDRKNLWFNSSKGIFRVSKGQFDKAAVGRDSAIVCSWYGKMDGIASSGQYREAHMPAACKALDGRLWFRSTHGVAVVDPNITTNLVPPLVAVEQVLADKKTVSESLRRPAHSQTDSLVIPPGRGELEIHYTALSFRAPEKNRFKYKLERVDREWVDADARRVAYYNNLAPGDYRFQVIASNNDGVWNETGASLALVLQPHVWQTWWFKGLCGLAAVGAVGGTARFATRRRMQRRLERVEQEHALETERSRIARDLHDNLGTRLMEILMLNEFSLQRSAEGGQELKPHLEKSASLVRDLAASLDAIVWAANPKNDSLDNFILYVYEYLDNLANVRPVRILRDVPAGLPDLPLSAAQRHNLFLVLMEALGNVFKHSSATEVWFRLRLENGTLTLVLEDNGKGFVPEATSELGNGLVNMDKRMKLIGGSFSVVSEPGAGTRLCMQMPLNGARRNGR